MAIWPGDPELSLQRTFSIGEGQSSTVSRIQMGTHTGTHVDAPLHLQRLGNDVAQIPLQSCIGPVRVMDFSGKTFIGAEDLLSRKWDTVERILFRTQRSGNQGNSFDPDFAWLDIGAASFLAEKGILLVGMDSPSVDCFDSTDLPAHNLLLGRGIVVVENLRLGDVPPGDYNLACVPLKIDGADGSPVRAVLWR